MEAVIEQSEQRLDPDVKPTSWEDRMGYWHAMPSGNLLVTPLVSEEMMATAYLRFHAEGLLGRIFHENHPSLSWFLQHYHRDEVCMLACLKEDPITQKLTPHGLGWIVNKFNVSGLYNKAEVGEAYFRHTSPRDTIWYGRRMIDYAFEQLDLAALYGSTPEPNIPAVRYARALGFRVHGPFPYYTAWLNEDTGQREPAAGYISVMPKEDWERRSWK